MSDRDEKPISDVKIVPFSRALGPRRTRTELSESKAIRSRAAKTGFKVRNACDAGDWSLRVRRVEKHPYEVWLFTCEDG
ncbi:hypothetical protein EVAR_23882_1 [Eumeta japonica]|uniref:Uncharacterized protein n=1 Tax=Eumeta variegata TaxID=151549 RepID=A0A4C1V4G4_EUMVA|nr:hypothetical protein EVAR_23882_1 [Eumeta japonica]